MPEGVIDKLYAEGIRRYGGTGSAPKEGCIEASLGAAYNAELYTETENSILGLVFSAYLLFYLTSNHCYLDGNKRIGWQAAMYALLTLGLTIDATDDEAEHLCLAIASGVMDAGKVAIWFSERLTSA